jgi:hypothetical protein
MFTQILQTILYLFVCAAVILVGWEQPLRYRFISSEQIAEIEAPPNSQSVVSHPPQPKSWRPMGTALDRAPYTTDNRGVIYTENIDFREMGTRSEQERRTNLLQGQGAR